MQLKAADTNTALSEFSGVDASGNQVTSLNAKENLYLDCCAAFNVDGKTAISDEEYEQLKTDLTFEGSKVMLMSREEIKFMVAARRYREGRPIMSNEEFDGLRKKLKARNSPAVLHDEPRCQVDSADGKVCKSDLYPDDGKNALLYAPAAVLTALLFNEGAFWLKGWDPILSLVLGSPFIIAATYILTNYIYFQNPYITKLSCPDCGTPQNVYFGDILFVNGKVQPVVTTQCVNKACGATLEADREKMVVVSKK